MSKNLSQKLIFICGSPCVGKTTATESLLYSYQNSAHLDDDWVWRVNPFSFDDPRNPSIYENMSFVLSSYLNLKFDYVFVSSVRMMYKYNRDLVLKNITAKDYEVIGFTLTCSKETLTERHRIRGDSGEVSFEWMNERHPGDFVVDTDGKSVEEIVGEIRNLIG